MSKHGGRRLLTAKSVMERFDISAMTLWRWVKDDRLGFPQPVYIRKRRYFDAAEINAFDERVNRGEAA